MATKKATSVRKKSYGIKSARKSTRKIDKGYRYKTAGIVAVLFLLTFFSVMTYYHSTVNAYTADKIIKPLPAYYSAGVLTYDQGDKFTLSSNGVDTVAAAKTINTGINTRIIFWNSKSPVLTNSEACTSFASADDETQEGVALRVSKDNKGIVSALTVLKNVYGPTVPATYSGFNVLAWYKDPAGNYSTFSDLGSFPFQSTFIQNGVLAPEPWSLCAKAIGNTLSFISWPANIAEPGWGTPGYSGSVQIPAAYSSGYTGWYFGHITAGKSITYSNLSSGSVAN